MDEHTRIIVKEIEFWKEHHLLPEHYCDFLMALYTKGNPVNHRDNKRIHWMEYFQIGILITLIPFSFLVIYFTKFHVLLQLGIFILFSVYVIWTVIYFKKNRNQLFHLPLVVMLILFLLYSVFTVKSLLLIEWGVYFVIPLNFMAWMFIGRKAKFKYLIISGLIGLVFSIFYIVL